MKKESCFTANITIFIQIILALILKYSSQNQSKQCSSILTHKYCNKNGISFKLELYQWCMTRIWCWKTRENFFFEKKGIFLLYYIKLSSFVVWIETKDRWRRVHFLEDMISRFFLAFLRDAKCLKHFLFIFKIYLLLPFDAVCLKIQNK